MRSIVGLFQTVDAAERAVAGLRSLGFDSRNINLLTPHSTAEEISEIPTTDMEATGVGKAFGGLVGGAIAAAGGVQIGMAAASSMLAGTGMTVVGGVAAAALLGTGGAVGGAALGELVENALDEGLPKDELYIYQDALKQGRSVMVFHGRDQLTIDTARRVMAEAGAEDLDVARENWWIGLRAAEEQHYTPAWGDFAVDEPCYRMGFEAAQRRALRARTYSSALSLLQKHFPIAVCNHPAFRRGFERGQAHREKLARETSKNWDGCAAPTARDHHNPQIVALKVVPAYGVGSNAANQEGDRFSLAEKSILSLN
jgi:hypothetical protein